MLYEQDLGAVGAIRKQFTYAYILKKSDATKSAILPLQETNQTVTPHEQLFGANCIFVSSLWTVSASATALLMIKFYEELQRQSQIAVALNTAQSWLRNTTVQGFQDWLRRSRLDRVWQRQLRNHFDEISREQGVMAKPFEKPYYWAAFCAIGKGE